MKDNALHQMQYKQHFASLGLDEAIHSLADTPEKEKKAVPHHL